MVSNVIIGIGTQKQTIVIIVAVNSPTGKCVGHRVPEPSKVSIYTVYLDHIPDSFSYRTAGLTGLRTNLLD